MTCLPNIYDTLTQSLDLNLYQFGVVTKCIWQHFPFELLLTFMHPYGIASLLCVLTVLLAFCISFNHK